MRLWVKERVIFTLISLTAYLAIGLALLLLIYLLVKGLPVLSLRFLLSPPLGMRGGGISTAIIGTILLLFFTALVSIPLGVASAIYLSEYTEGADPRFLRLIRVTISNLAGVPSIVYGLLGLGLFVLTLHLGLSIISASLTLSILTLPTVIAASEEALRAVPREFREASLALGATRWQTIRNIVLPSAYPGILTACILGLSRAAGETAPLLMTGAAYYIAGKTLNLLGPFMALSTHIYYMSTQSPNPTLTRPIQYGSIAVLLLIVLSLNLAATVMRLRYRRGRR